MKRNKLMALTALLTIFATPSSKAQEVKGGSKQSTSAQSSNKDSKNAFVGSMMSIGYGWIKNNLPWLITTGITTSVSGAVGNKMGKKTSGEKSIKERIASNTLFTPDIANPKIKQRASEIVGSKTHTQEAVNKKVDEEIQQKLKGGEFINADDNSVQQAAERLGIKYKDEDFNRLYNTALKNIMSGKFTFFNNDENKFKQKKSDFEARVKKLDNELKESLNTIQKQLKLDFQTNLSNMSYYQKLEDGNYGNEQNVDYRNALVAICMLDDLRTALVDGQLDPGATFEPSYLGNVEEISNKLHRCFRVVCRCREYKVSIDAGAKEGDLINIESDKEKYSIKICKENNEAPAQPGIIGRIWNGTKWAFGY